MATSRQIVRELKLNYGVIQAQVDGLSDDDALVQPPYRGNCLNWVLGHVVHSRGAMLELLEMEPLWHEDAYARYVRESEPILCADDALPIQQILADLCSSQEQLLARVKRLDDAALDRMPNETVPTEDERSLGERLSFLSWHETYHVGQTEALRQLAGKADKVI